MTPLERQFWQFCANLTISTKDYGEMKFTKPNGCQRAFASHIFDGVAEGIHTFVVLKGRQQGISTICLALDLFWAFRHSGIQCSLISQDEATRDDFRMKLQQNYDSLPAKWKRTKVQHNRNQFVFKNKSSIIYAIAGAKTGNKLGRGKAITYLHATELGSWGNNTDGLGALQAALAELHPHRLFIYESTANGTDMFYDMYQSARKAVTQRALFIGWWLKEDYSVPANSPAFMTYIGKVREGWTAEKYAEADEREWIRQIRREYNFIITPEQLAWWRLTLHEKQSSDLDMMYQEFPPLPEMAFRVTGTEFFTSSALNRQLEYVKAARENVACHRVVTGAKFFDTHLFDATDKTANLTVWEQPDYDGYYTIGGDVAYGSNEWKDASVASVFRSYGDRSIQVAEFCSTSVGPTEFAWILVFLAAYYGRSVVNIELNGPGQAVFQEFERLRKTIGAGLGEEGASPEARRMVQSMRNYVFHRYAGGRVTSGVKHWMTTAATKERMMSILKDGISTDTVRLRSQPLISEMRTVVREGSVIGSQGRNKDDRVIAAALATVAWADNHRMQLLQQRITSDTRPEKPLTKEQQQGQWLLNRFLQSKAVGAR